MERLADFCNRLEARLGLPLAAIVLSFIVLLLASIYVTPALQLVQLGKLYGALSSEPFNFVNQSPLQFRILTPLIAHLLFLRGKLFIFMPLIIALLFLSSIYLFFRKYELLTPSQSLAVMCLIAFSSPLLFLLRFQGYVDITTYLFVFLCYFLIERKNPLWYLCFALGLVNHESIIFMAPVFIWLENKPLKLKKVITSLTLLGLSFVPALLYRKFVLAHMPVAYDANFYLSIYGIKRTIWTSYRMQPLGIFMAFKLFWAIPVFALVKTIKAKDYYEAALITLILATSIMQLPLSSDMSRVMGLAFLSILVGVRVIKKYFTQQAFSNGLWILIGFNLLVPQYYVGQESASPFFMFPLSWVYGFFGYNWGIYF